MGNLRGVGFLFWVYCFTGVGDDALFRFWSQVSWVFLLMEGMIFRVCNNFVTNATNGGVGLSVFT